jgi:hypothetical protein
MNVGAGIGVLVGMVVCDDDEESGSSTPPVAGTAPAPVSSSDPEALSAAHIAAAAVGDKTAVGYGGNCTPDEFDKLKRKQDEICGDHRGGPSGYVTAESLKGCGKTGRHPGGARMTNDELAARRDAWSNCAKARDEVAQCFAGGNKGHRDAVDNALQAAAKCEEFMK